jgi:hypothetical protein
MQEVPESPNEGAKDENQDMISEGSEEAYLHDICIKCPARWDYGTSRTEQVMMARSLLNRGKSLGY